MRLLYSILMTTFLLGGTYLYTDFAESVRRQPLELQVAFDSSIWRVVIERTFECRPDPDLEAPALSVQFKGEPLLSRLNSIPVAETIEISPIEGVEQGDNELFVEANLASTGDFEFDSSQMSHALRVLIYRGSDVVVDETKWLAKGDYAIVASVAFEAPDDDENHDTHGH